MKFDFHSDGIRFSFGCILNYTWMDGLMAGKPSSGYLLPI